MVIHERTAGPVSILDVEGRITVQEGAATLREAIQRLAARNQVNLVINMQAVPYIDSTALGELVSAFATTARLNGALKLMKPASRVRDLLAVTHLASIFEIHDTEESAVNSFHDRV